MATKLTLVNVGYGCRCPNSIQVFVQLPVQPDGTTKIPLELIEKIQAHYAHVHLPPPPHPPIDESKYRFITYGVTTPRKNVLLLNLKDI